MSNKDFTFGPSKKKPKQHGNNRRCKVCNAVLSSYNPENQYFRHGVALLGAGPSSFDNFRSSTGKSHSGAD